MKKSNSQLSERFALLTPDIKGLGDDQIVLDGRDVVRKIVQWMYLFQFSSDRDLPVWTTYSDRYGLSSPREAAQWCYQNPVKAKTFLKGVLQDVVNHLTLVQKFA